MLSFFLKIKQALDNKKAVKGILVFSFVLFLLLIPNISHAALFDIGYKFLSKIAFGISSLIALIGGMVVAVLIIALQMIIQVSTGIVNSTPVQLGFPIVLSIANLGFVLAIIVIAVATILRQEGYGIKKLLAQVVIMAVMVNFGLVISGAVIGFSNRVTNYFLDSMTGNGATDFATIMAGTMNPQKAFEWADPVEIGDTDAATSTVVKNKADAETQARLGNASQNGGSFGSLLLPTFSVVLTIVNIVIMIITLAVILGAFIVRYIKITFYLIVLPAAWMASVFPGNNWFSQWRSGFIKHVFYPPIVIFFLWLAMRVATGMSAGDGLKFEAVKGSGPFSDFLGNMLGVPLQAILQMIVIAGIMLGGNTIAGILGTSGSKTAEKWTKNAGQWASGKVKTGLRRTGTRALDTGVAKKATGAVSRGLGTIGNKLGGVGAEGGRVGKIFGAPIRGIGGVIAGGGNAAERYTTRAKEQMGASVSKSYKDDVAKMGEEELKVRSKVATGLELAAILERASNNPKLMTAVMNNIPDANKKSMAGDGDLYKRYGYGKTHEAAMLASGITYDKKKGAVDTAAKTKAEVDGRAGATDEEKKVANEAFIKAEKDLTDELKKLTPEAANNLIFNKDGKIENEARAKDIMKSLAGPNGWPAGKFTQLVQQSSENGNLDTVRGLFEGLEAKDISATIVKALENGALKNLGIDGASVMGDNLFNQAKEHHGIGEKDKKEKKGGPTTAVFE